MRPIGSVLAKGEFKLGKKFRQPKAMSRGGHNWKSTGTVEGTRSINVMELVREGCLSRSRFGSIEWRSDDGTKASIRITADREAVTLDYLVKAGAQDWQTVHQRVPISWTPCRLGGERPWFVCDVHANGVYCGRQVTKLYGAGRLFACRHCYRLGYAVQRGGPMDRAHHRLRRLHRKRSSDDAAQLTAVLRAVRASASRS